MPGILPRQRLPVRQLEIRKIESRRHRAADERIFSATGNRRTKPAARTDDRKKCLPLFRIAAQPVCQQPPAMCDLKDLQWVAGIEVPKLVGRNAMKGGELTLGQQEVNMRGSMPVTLEEQGKRMLGKEKFRTINLSKCAAFDMTGQLQFLQPIGGVWSHSHSDQCSTKTCGAA